MSKYGLIGMVSGAGQGLANAAHTGMQIFGASMLAKERGAMEDRRLQLMQQFEGERDQRTQDFQRGLQQERLGADVLMRSQDRQSLEGREQRSQDFQRGLQQEKMGSEVLRESMRQGHETSIHDADRADRKLELSDKLAQEDRHHQDSFSIETQKLAIARLQHGDEVREVQTGEDGSQWAVMKSGTPKLLVNPATNEPIKSPKGLSDAVKETVSFIEKRIAAKEKLASDPMTSSEEATKLRREIDSLSRNAMLILGNREKEKTGPVQLVDPDDAPNPTESMTAKETEKKPEQSSPSGISLVPGMSALPSIGSKIKEIGGEFAAKIMGVPGKSEETAVASEPSTSESSGFVKPQAVEGARKWAGLIPGSSVSPPPETVVTKESQDEWRKKYGEEFKTEAEEGGRPAGEHDGGQRPEPSKSGIIATSHASLPPKAADLPAPSTLNLKRGKAYEKDILEASQQTGVKPELIAAVMDVESNFNTKAVGPEVEGQGTAKGLMQFMDKTGAQYGVTDPFDSTQNIKGGAKYLAYLLKKYDGYEAKAVAAYNFGEGNIDAGMEWPTETKKYVLNVLAKAKAYSGKGQ